MTRTTTLICVVVVISLSLFSMQAQELPPYSPTVDGNLMTSYLNSELGFTIRFPVEFKVGTTQDLKSVMDLGHRAVRGTDPDNDQEHAQAVKCMHSLLYSASEAPKPSDGIAGTSSGAPDTFLVVDFDRTCVPKKVKGDKTLTQLAGTVLNLPGMTQLVPQTWFVGGGSRRIHSGMAGGMISIPARDAAGGTLPSREVATYVLAAAFEQKDHWILVAYLSGTNTDLKHEAFPYTAVSFEDGRPVLLFPFLLGKMNVVK
jgi:hypothetical protein